MKRIIYSIAALLSLGTVAQQPHDWTRSMGTSGQFTEGYAIAVDDFGNVYTCGVFGDMIDMDPGIGTFMLNTTVGDSGYRDMFIQKLDSNGQFIWAKHIKGTNGEEIPTDVQVSPSGHLYISGYYSGGAVDFDPDPNNTHYEVANPGTRAFVLKLDLDGNFVWQRQTDGYSTDAFEAPYSLGLDEDENVYIAGDFVNAVDFDPDNSTFFLVAPIGGCLFGGDCTNPFVWKLDSAGNFVWAKTIGTELTENGNGIAVAPDGTSYLTGTFNDTVDFDPGSGTYNMMDSVNGTGGYDSYVLKLNSSGDFVWAVRNASGPKYQGGGSIVLDPWGSLYVYGGTVLSADFDPGSGTYNLSAGNIGAPGYAFTQKLDTNGNFQWALLNGNTTNVVALSRKALAFSDAGHIYNVSRFYGTRDLDPGTGVMNFTAQGGGAYDWDGFIQKLDTGGALVWVNQIKGSSNSERPNAIAIGPDASVYVTGGFSDSADFDANANVTYYLTATGSQDAFVHKLKSPCPGSVYTEIAETACSSYTSPSGNATWTQSGTYEDVLTSISGCDSIVIIDLTIQTSPSTSLSVSACQSYTSPSGNHVWTSSGNYTDTLVNASSNGCDSIVHVNLTISSATTGSTAQTACNSYVAPSGNHVWSTSGTYTDTLINAGGCDSILTVNLTITPWNSASLAVTANGNTLTSAAGNATFYQWVDCSNGFSAISGATSQSYTPNSTGSYAVVITENGCTDTSACTDVVLGVGAHANETGLTVYPNPSDGSFILDLGSSLNSVSVTVVNSSGHLVSRLKYQGVSRLPITLKDRPAGVYFIHMESETTSGVVKLILM